MRSQINIGPGARAAGLRVQSKLQQAGKLPSLLCALAICSSAFISSNAVADALVLMNVTVHTGSGPVITNGYVMIENGKIKAVGPGNEKPPIDEAPKLDLKGLHLYPGMVALDTALGLSEIGAVRSTRDETEVGDFIPDVESWIAVNPSSEIIPVVRANGIAYIEPAPQGAMVPGQSSVVALDGWTTEEMVFKKQAALHVVWPEMELDLTPKDKFSGDKSKWKSVEDQAKERDKKIRTLQDFFSEARAYAKAKAADKSATTLQFIPAWEAMIPYVNGELPVMIHANELRQITHSIKWAQTNDLKAVIVGGRDAVLATNELVAAKMAVVYENVYTPRYRDSEAYDIHFKTPSLLQKAGIKIAISMGPETFDGPLTKNLPYQAAQAIAFGLPEEEALKSITLYPAQLMGVGDKIGSIEAGKEATFFTMNGSVFDMRAQVKHMWIAGKELSLENRHTRLYEKYKGRPKAK
ncbi:MAG: Amidohydrolase [Verrucomicrobiales bacterium]|nr:Amidohydrolase [Verrucomicrobiales bacterium]